jgi:DNA-binding NarL/FixJ family response regulator
LCREERRGWPLSPRATSSSNGSVQERLGVSRLEIDALRGILAGLTVADIGRELDLPDSTAKVRLRRLFVKLDVHEKALMSRSWLVARAYRSGLLARAGVIRCIRGSSLVPQ